MESKSIKVGITQKAEDAVIEMLKKVNEGFNAGRITKTDLISWIVIQFSRERLESSIDEIRKDHFDQVRYMEAMLKDLRARQKNGETIPKFEINFNAPGQ